jgi:hypothetical protein
MTEPGAGDDAPILPDPLDPILPDPLAPQLDGGIDAGAPDGGGDAPILPPPPPILIPPWQEPPPPWLPTPPSPPPPPPPDAGTPGQPDAGVGDGDGDGDGAGCFATGTLVAIADAGYRPIEEIKIDDLVASRDEMSRADRLGRVTRTWTHYEKKAVSLWLENGEIICVTPVHRVFTAGHDLVSVAGLQVGDCVETLSAGPQAIVDITPGPSSATVHNLAVADYHTYFVGAVGMWVHNDKDIDDGSGDGDEPPDGADDGDD